MEKKEIKLVQVPMDKKLRDRLAECRNEQNIPATVIIREAVKRELKKWGY